MRSDLASAAFAREPGIIYSGSRTLILRCRRKLEMAPRPQSRHDIVVPALSAPKGGASAAELVGVALSRKAREDGLRRKPIQSAVHFRHTALSGGEPLPTQSKGG